MPSKSPEGWKRELSAEEWEGEEAPERWEREGAPEMWEGEGSTERWEGERPTESDASTAKDQKHTYSCGGGRGRKEAANHTGDVDRWLVPVSGGGGSPDSTVAEGDARPPAWRWLSQQRWRCCGGGGRITGVEVELQRGES
ncbi:hypothetical protein Taro_015796 [Colocasia esculenta]|uniref:Uncharacterized protein n=1 Tax=Colocasia esculenta TaxID=4460 RepID=A0A843UN83_COLES|nr:hypothetical protein [Colocasia esculenta]